LTDRPAPSASDPWDELVAFCEHWRLEPPKARPVEHEGATAWEVSVREWNGSGLSTDKAHWVTTVRFVADTVARAASSVQARLEMERVLLPRPKGMSLPPEGDEPE
jgi:hypothetical protein